MAMRELEKGAVLQQILPMQMLICSHPAACSDLRWHSSQHMPEACYDQSHNLVPHQLDSDMTLCGR